MIVTKGETMKSATTGAVSGCLVWVIACGVISMCILPISMAMGGMTSASDYAINFTGKFICPDGTKPESYSYATTTRDENGNEQPSTAYELHCVADNGEVLKSDPVGYAFMWIGIFVIVGLVLTSVLAFVFAAPAGVLISRASNRIKKTNTVENIASQ
jgi:ABC-type glycerol-3-phosphate transport system permease component